MHLPEERWKRHPGPVPKPPRKGSLAEFLLNACPDRNQLYEPLVKCTGKANVTVRNWFSPNLEE